MRKGYTESRLHRMLLEQALLFADSSPSNQPAESKVSVLNRFQSYNMVKDRAPRGCLKVVLQRVLANQKNNLEQRLL